MYFQYHESLKTLLMVVEYYLNQASGYTMQNTLDNAEERVNRIYFLFIFQKVKNSAYSHSMVAGGLLDASQVTREMPLILLMMRFDTFSSSSQGKCAQRAVIKSTVSAARSAITYS